MRNCDEWWRQAVPSYNPWQMMAGQVEKIWAHEIKGYAKYEQTTRNEKTKQRQ